MYFCLDPPATALLAFLYLGEEIHLNQIIGAILILSGMYMTIHFGEKIISPPRQSAVICLMESQASKCDMSSGPLPQKKQTPAGSPNLRLVTQALQQAFKCAAIIAGLKTLFPRR